MIYLDTSALVKLVIQEPESPALEDWLDRQHALPKLSSQVATVELIRTCRPLSDAAVSNARQLLAGVDLVPLSEDLVEAAALLGPLELRSVDAIHLASALSMADRLSSFVVYDGRLGAAAESAGLPVASPA
ncbi:MAG: type II toxin-antitoxin system VapC family toxin [Acidimicrobiales bacterium]